MKQEIWLLAGNCQVTETGEKMWGEMTVSFACSIVFFFFFSFLLFNK